MINKLFAALISLSLYTHQDGNGTKMEYKIVNYFRFSIIFTIFAR